MDYDYGLSFLSSVVLGSEGLSGRRERENQSERGKVLIKCIGDGILRLQLPKWLHVQYQRSHPFEQIRLLYLPSGESGWY